MPPDLSTNANDQTDAEVHQSTVPTEPVPEAAVTGPTVATHPEGTAQPASQPEVIAPDSQHLNPGIVPVSNSLGYLPPDVAAYGTRPAIPEGDLHKTIAQRAEHPEAADGDLQAAAGTAANHYSREGDKHDPRDPNLTAALSKVQGTVPIAQHDQTFTKDATPNHELSDPKPQAVPHKAESAHAPETK